MSDSAASQIATQIKEKVIEGLKSHIDLFNSQVITFCRSTETFMRDTSARIDDLVKTQSTNDVEDKLTLIQQQLDALKSAQVNLGAPVRRKKPAETTGLIAAGAIAGAKSAPKKKPEKKAGYPNYMLWVRDKWYNDTAFRMSVLGVEGSEEYKKNMKLIQADPNFGKKTDRTPAQKLAAEFTAVWRSVLPTNTKEILKAEFTTLTEQQSGAAATSVPQLTEEVVEHELSMAGDPEEEDLAQALLTMKA